MLGLVAWSISIPILFYFFLKSDHDIVKNRKYEFYSKFWFMQLIALSMMNDFFFLQHLLTYEYM